MVIPERTRRVHKVVVPFLLVKLGVVLFSLMSVVLVVIGIDYFNVLGRLGENKALKGENFKLRQEIQTVKNKVDSLEVTIERVRNYAKKLQLLTGQGNSKGQAEMPVGPVDIEPDRIPANRSERRSENIFSNPDFSNVSVKVSGQDLDEKIKKLRVAGEDAENELSKLHTYLIAKSAVINATPSLLPIAGWISSNFGYRRNPYDGSYRLHSGVDIAAEPGTPVRAPADGSVIFSGYREGYGKVIVIDHGYGIRTLFAHNSSVFVGQGAKVVRGETISQVGNTGRSTGPHLHYEIRKNGVPVNPTTFFSRARF
ncbi:MAG: M23 family metallopeptidase [Proteobacteria bacterium]|jgi:murein DD-endopeptidase MepM/ murein hydrolase activator NlpD|nr:M23 family metallopeptidase [Pseudomonadota bacterium]